MLTPIRYYIGGRISSGKQGFSFIHIEDLIRAFDFMISNSLVQGKYNLCAPSPSTNKEFTKLLAKAHHRPAFMVIPKFFLRLMYGKRAEMLIYGQKVIPERLKLAGFQFLYPDAESVINNLLISR
jgi:NAD dependent epimerase/dehydratase family enzyme